MTNMEDFVCMSVIAIGVFVATFLLNTGRGLQAIQLGKECLILLNNIDPKKQEHFFKLFKIRIYKMIFNACCLIPDYTNAVNYGKELVVSCREWGATAIERNITIQLAEIYMQQCKYTEAQELYNRVISIMRETGDRKGERKAYGNLGKISYCLGDYAQAKEYCEKALVISVEIGDREKEATDFTLLGVLTQFLGEYVKAIEYNEKALAISIEIGDRKIEAQNYECIGLLYQSLGDYVKAKDYYEKALAIELEIGDRKGEGSSYANIGTVSFYLGKYVQAKEYFEKAIAIRMEIGDREGKAEDLGKLGNVFQCLGDYARAIEYHEKEILIRNEIGDKDGEASGYVKLESLFHSLGENAKAKEYHEKALAIRKQIGDGKKQPLTAQASSYENQAHVFESLGKYLQAKEYLEKALAIRMEIGERGGIASSYQRLGNLLRSLGEYIQAREYYEKALVIYTGIGRKEGEAVAYTGLGNVSFFLGDLVMAEGYLEKALSISKEIGLAVIESFVCCLMSGVKVVQDKIEEAGYFLRMSISQSEDLREFLKDNDQLKISFSDARGFSHRIFILLCCLSKNANTALCVLELRRARALAELMAAQYSVEIMQISAHLHSRIGIENVMKKESNCTCLYISLYPQHVFLWILTTSGIIHFRSKTVNANDAQAGLPRDLEDFFAKSFRSFGTLPDEKCEDRSLNNVEPNPKSSRKESLFNFRNVEENDEFYQDPEPLFYKMLIAPVADLLVEPEIVIVPDRDLYKVPFSALRDEDGKYLSESFRIRIIPSLTTLELIQDSPADYHSESGALIVGDPVVGRVLNKGSVENKKPLPCARKEAEMIGRLLGVQPLIGEHATKQAVLQVIHSVSLIHFAAHGNAERGEIALSPVRCTNRIPEEEEYLLTMSDISQVQLRAKLVVLSCCHSGSGQIRAEGVAGIARAFLGSGARSVLVALWALEDSATEKLIRCFYQHLVRGESASECLHQAMKWMRCNGYSDVRQWAPFMLIGDNVKFDIEKIKVKSTYHISLCSLSSYGSFLSRKTESFHVCMLPIILNRYVEVGQTLTFNYALPITGHMP